MTTKGPVKNSRSAARHPPRKGRTYYYHPGRGERGSISSQGGEANVIWQKRTRTTKEEMEKETRCIESELHTILSKGDPFSISQSLTVA